MTTSPASRLIIETSGRPATEEVAVEPGECLLIGRAPDVSKVTERLPPLQATLKTVDGANVSTNHVAVWSDGSRVSLLDLESKNGTWLRLPRGEVVGIVASPGEIHLRLAASAKGTASIGSPEAPRYVDHVDFGASISHSVRKWVARADVPARVWTLSRDRAGEAPSAVATFPLASGDVLLVQLERTADASFYDHMAVIGRFVSTENALYASEDAARGDGMVLASSRIREVHRRVVEVAMQGLPSLVLLGPSGTGKELLARAYHRHLGRGGPVVAINCASLNRDRMIADLFGAEAGAYTDAKRVMVGAVERADGGTLFLDELGELASDVQPMLLRFLETGEYHRLGAAGGPPRFADVRVVAATNRDLRDMVRRGFFREDLFFRLALEIVQVPPLADRFEDAEAYLRGRRLGATSAFAALAPSAVEQLRAYAWPGNFRELINFVRRLPAGAETGAIEADEARRALEAGALAPMSIQAPSKPPVSGLEGSASWIAWVEESARAFAATRGDDGPRTWEDVASFVETFLKPWALVHVAGIEAARSMDDVAVAQVASRIHADRGTVVKQLRRWFALKDEAALKG